MSGRVEGKAALVTGGGGGLGSAIAWMLAREGACVTVTDINEASAASVAGAINAQWPGRAWAFRHDVVDEGRWREVVDTAAAAMGGLSILVNNAGVGQPRISVQEEESEAWLKLYEVNLKSVMLGCKHAMPHLRRAAPAAIVNVSSIAALVSSPGIGGYSATKAGVWAYTKTVALEAARQGWGVRCNSVHPAFVDTRMLDGFGVEPGRNLDAVALARGIPLKRLGTPDEVASAVLFLASEEASFITGAELKVDGGLTAA